MSNIKLVDGVTIGPLGYIRRPCLACGIHKTASNLCAACAAIWDSSRETLEDFIIRSRKEQYA